MSEVRPGVKRWDEPVELSEERAELLPDRTTLAAVDIGRKEVSPTNASVVSATSDNFPIGSPSSNNATIGAGAAPEVTGGFMPVVITLVPSINLIVQKSDLDSLGVGHHSGDGHVDAAPVDDHTDYPYANGGWWMDFLRRWFGI
jgi:hypothetical protein